MKGTVVSICTAPSAAAAVQIRDQVRAVPGKGLEGDRYFNGAGTFQTPNPDCELTLIQMEHIDALKREFGVQLAPQDARRNIITRQVSLNDLVDAEFQIGEVTARGIRLREPCSHLEQLTGQPVVKGLHHKGGLRAQIITGGTIRVGDIITVPRES